ncbi:F-box protein [Senna tora]|uniref:F-box protein n=1 Tax=Senna tora TaxID=362788 RepID=A0A834T0Y5_9FABA|nr:F-box protein [Senna tora]
MSEVEKNWDFIHWLVPDLSIKILTYLDDPCDLVRVSSVSSAWHQFVIENGMCKKLCLKKFPELSGVAHVIEVDNVIEPVRYMLGNSMNWECLKRNHKVYAFLARGLTPSVKNNCISETISASSTDNYPQESIQNTLEPRESADLRVSYWSSKGESDPSVPERLIYKLASKICVVTEIHVRPFQAFFQYGSPIYSAKAVRFRMGHPRYPKELNSTLAYKSIAKHVSQGKEFVWTYTSPEFPMAQENRLQKFELPEPVLCVGGVLLVELLGRVQKQQMDELYYICITHVQVVGRPLSPEFSVKIHHPSGKCTLKYYPQTDCYMSSTSSSSSGGDSSSPSRLRTFASNIMPRGVRRWEQIILGALLGNSGAVRVDD